MSRALQASLPMYALPGMAAANEALWAALAGALAEAGLDTAKLPAALSAAGLALPERILPETLFSQMCGYPLRHHYAGQYRLLGTPLYDMPGCSLGADDVPQHCSFLVIRRDDAIPDARALRGRRFAINGWDSNSGMNLPRRLLAPLAGGAAYFAAVVESGSHLASMEMVAAGLADAAAIDCVTHGFVCRHHPALAASLRVLAETPAAPAIPFITAATTPPETAALLTRLLVEPPAALRQALRGLGIVRVAPPRPEAYEVVLRLEQEAADLGYPVLR